MQGMGLLNNEAAPRDPFHASRLIMLLQGVGALFPWNALITPQSFYRLLFTGSQFGASYESMITSTFTLVGLFTLLALQSLQHLASLRTFIVGSLTVELAVFLVITFSAVALLSHGALEESALHDSATARFGGLMACVAVAGVAQATLSGSICSYAATFGPAYIQAVSVGMAVAGLMVSLAEVITELPGALHPKNDTAAAGDTSDAAEDTVQPALWYFCTATLVLLVCIAAFFLLERLPYARHVRRTSLRLSAEQE